MSSFRLSLLRPLAIAVIVGVTVGACGFRPMYGQRVGRIATGELAAVEIMPIPGRIGQFLRNQLLDLLTPRGRPAEPMYFLTVTLKESSEELAVRKNTFATRANLHMSADFSLSDAKSKSREVLFSGRSEIISSYNILNSSFATLMAEKEARNRATLEISKDIGLRLNVFLQQRINSQGPPGRDSPVK